MFEPKNGTVAANGMSRRSFLSGAAAAGVGAAAGLAVASSTKAFADEAEEAEAEAEEAEAETEEAAAEESTESSSGMNGDKYFDKWDFEIPEEGITDDEIAETIEAEIIVVGAGTAGLVTANSAAEEGADVVLISASSAPVARGGSNHAVYSKTMEELGVEPNDISFYEKEMKANGSHVDARKWYKYYNNSEEAMNWLIDIMEGLGYSTGIETLTPTIDNEAGATYYAPGAHGFYNDENPGMGYNQPLVVEELASRLEELTGRSVYYNNIARQLVRGDVANGTEGRVTAVIAEREDGTYAKYVGSKAIVLATGDFSTNYDMMSKYCPQGVRYISEDVFNEETDYDRSLYFGGLYPGDGQKMGLWIGAAWQKAWPCGVNALARTAGPNNGGLNFCGLAVTRDGTRYCNEFDGPGPLSMVAETTCPGGVTYSIWDMNYAEQMPFGWYDSSVPYGQDSSITVEDTVASWDSSVEGGSYVRGDTIEEVIEALGLPEEATLATIESYNAMCEAGEDTEFYKDASLMIPVNQGPFYGAVNDSSWFLSTLGGLRTDDNMKVCDEDDNPIEGLYNVGSMVGDMFYAQYTYMIPGFCLGTCVTFGYLLGKYIVENE